MLCAGPCSAEACGRWVTGPQDSSCSLRHPSRAMLLSSHDPRSCLRSRSLGTGAVWHGRPLPLLWQHRVNTAAAKERRVILWLPCRGGKDPGDRQRKGGL